MSVHYKNTILVWISIFMLILALTQSHHWINYSNAPSWLGFPSWLWWFMGFHLILIIALIGFAKRIENE